MKNFLFLSVVAALIFCACNNDNEPMPQAGEMPAPQITRSAGSTITSATVSGFNADENPTFQRDLSYNGTEWQWAGGTSSLNGVENLICVVPSISSTLNTATAYTPDEKSILMWDKAHISEQTEEGRFLFHNMKHCLAQMRIVVDRYFSVDELTTRFSASGTFNALTGSFTSVDAPTARRIFPANNGDGTYTYTFSIVPQTFKKGATLLTYKDIYSEGYYTYTHKLTEDVTVKPNQRLTVRMEWNSDDWGGGSYTETKAYISTSITVADWTVNETIEGEATENN